MTKTNNQFFFEKNLTYDRDETYLCYEGMGNCGGNCRKFVNGNARDDVENIARLSFHFATQVHALYHPRRFFLKNTKHIVLVSSGTNLLIQKYGIFFRPNESCKIS